MWRCRLIIEHDLIALHCDWSVPICMAVQVQGHRRAVACNNIKPNIIIYCYHWHLYYMTKYLYYLLNADYMTTVNFSKSNSQHKSITSSRSYTAMRSRILFTQSKTRNNYIFAHEPVAVTKLPSRWLGDRKALATEWDHWCQWSAPATQDSCGSVQPDRQWTSCCCLHTGRDCR